MKTREFERKGEGERERSKSENKSLKRIIGIENVRSHVNRRQSLKVAFKDGQSPLVRPPV